VAVSASAEGRRAVLGGLLAGVIAIAPAAQAVDILDATKVRDAGFDLIYQARDLDLPQVCTMRLRLIRCCRPQANSFQVGPQSARIM
jgi:photosystem II oxygen-evolving enhancer protein 3